MAAYIQFTSRLKSTTQDGILAEAQQIAVSSSDNTSIKSYIDSKVASVAGAAYRPKGSVTFAALSALTSASVGDVYNITDSFTLNGKNYAAGSNVACLKAFSAKVTPDETYWDVLGGFIDLSPYAKSTELETAKSDLQGKIDATNAQVTTLARKLDERVDSNLVLKDMGDCYQISGPDDNHPAKIGKESVICDKFRAYRDFSESYKILTISDKDSEVQLQINSHATLGDSFEAMDDIVIGKHVYITEDTIPEAFFGTKENQYGTGVTINPNGIKVYHAKLAIGSGVTIGNDVTIGSDVTISSSDGIDIAKPGVLDYSGRIIIRPGFIADDTVILGSNSGVTVGTGSRRVQISPNVSIGNGVTIGEGVTIPGGAELYHDGGTYGFGPRGAVAIFGSGVTINCALGSSAVCGENANGVLISGGVALTSTNGGELWFGTNPTTSTYRKKVAFADDVEAAQTSVTELTKRVAALESLLTVAS